MSNFPIPLQLGGVREDSGALKVVTTAATINTKSAWVEMIASTAEDWIGFYLKIRQWLGSQEVIVWDVAVGASGSEVIILPNWLEQKGSDGHHATYGPFFAPIPAGSRIAIRNQNQVTLSSANATAGISGITGSDWSLPSPSKMIDIGVDLTNTQGTTVLGASGSGTWVEIDASLAEDISGLILHLDQQTNADSAAQIQIGIGASGSEVVLTPTIEASIANGQRHALPQHLSLPYAITAGTRIAARIAGNTVNWGVSFTGLVL